MIQLIMNNDTSESSVKEETTMTIANEMFTTYSELFAPLPPGLPPERPKLFLQDRINSQFETTSQSTIPIISITQR